MNLLDNIRVATETLNGYLIDAARLRIKVDLLTGISPLMQDSVDQHFYIAKCILVAHSTDTSV